MLRTKLATLALLPALAFGYAACVGAVDTEPDTEEAQAALEVDVDEGIIMGRTALLGTYRDWAPEAGQMKLFVLLGDGTYHREFAVKCTQLWCGPGEDEGTWAVWRHERETFVSLFPPTGRWEMYQTTLVDNRIHMKGLDGEQILIKTDLQAWCDVPRQCSLQDLPAQATCLPAWSCERHLCNVECPVIVLPELTE